jgi:transposase InsO family protein
MHLRNPLRCIGFRRSSTSSLIQSIKKTTIPDPDATINVVDLVKRVFGPGTIEVNSLWCSDISYVRTWEGWMYLATVLDVGSRRVVGWAMADHMRAELVCDALTMAIEHRRPAAGLIFHSDRGCSTRRRSSPRCSRQTRSTSHCLSPASVGTTRWRRASLSTLKCELIHRNAWPTHERARRAIFEFIEIFYNRSRLHSSLGVSVTCRVRKEVRTTGPHGCSRDIVNVSRRFGGAPCNSSDGLWTRERSRSTQWAACGLRGLTRVPYRSLCVESPQDGSWRKASVASRFGSGVYRPGSDGLI